MKNADMPAMPAEYDHNKESTGNIEQYTGLMKREAFAMAALQGLSGAHNHDGEWSHDSKLVAGVAVEYADALLEELERTSCNSN
jgi:hypothetical protein